MLKKIFDAIKNHKIIALILIIAIVYGGYYGYNKIWGGTAAVTKYVIGSVEKGTLTTSVSGTGQISASNQIDIKPKVSGDIVSLSVTQGQTVKTNDIIAKIDSSDASKTVRDAQVALESAKLSMEKLQQPTDASTILQAENSLTQANDSLTKLKLSQQIEYQKAVETEQNAQSDLAKAYDDGFNTVSNAFLQLPDIMTGLQQVLYSKDFNDTQSNIDYYADMVKNYAEIVNYVNKADQYKNIANDSYNTARDGYDDNFDSYKSANRSSDDATIEVLVDETYATTSNISEAVKNATNLLQYYKDKLTERNLRPNSLVDTYLVNLNSYTSDANSTLSSLLTIKNTIKNSNQTITDAKNDLQQMDLNNPLNISAAEQSIQEKTAALADLKKGADTLDIKAQQLSIKQKENALADAREKLADYTVRAPFDGVLASVDVKKGDTASSGTAIAVLITPQSIAEITLNEVDITKIQIGQKATLTFDAVENLTITGTVIEMDTIGTVSQGVVSYAVKIGFDTQDERVKPGMSTTATIITESKQEVLTVPSSAIKTQGEINYVEVPDETIDSSASSSSNGIALIKSPKQQQVEIGISNDTSTEIISGLSEGEQIITKTTSSSTTSTSTTSNKSSSAGGLFEMGGGGPRD